MHTVYYIILIASTFFFASLMTWLAHYYFIKTGQVDMPEERSNHTAPVPTGAGIGFIPMALGFMMVSTAPGNLLWPALLLCVISFMDDRKGMAISKRLGFQAIAVVIATTTIDGMVFQGLLPFWLDQIVVGLIWIGFINLYNFMDGIDEMTVTQTGSLCVGVLVLGLASTLPRFLSIDAVIILTAVLAFLPWNRHPAKMFMGDAGSIPLGFLMAYLLFNVAAHGEWVAALILPAYYLLDGGVTITRRALAKKPIWQAHSEHFYQQAVRAGRSHHEVSREVLMLNVILLVLACVSLVNDIAGYAALVLAIAATSALLYRFSHPLKAKSHAVTA